MVIKCASEIETKSEINNMVVHAAKEILSISDVNGGEIQGILEKGFGGSQTGGKYSWFRFFVFVFFVLVFF